MSHGYGSINNSVDTTEFEIFSIAFHLFFMYEVPALLIDFSETKNTGDDSIFKKYTVLWLAGLYFMLTVGFRGFTFPSSVSLSFI